MSSFAVITWYYFNDNFHIALIGIKMCADFFDNIESPRGKSIRWLRMFHNALKEISE